MPENATFPYPKQGATLQALADQHQALRIDQLVNDEAGRLETFSADGAGLHLDYSRHLLSAEARRELLSLAREAGLEAARDDLFNGEKINLTEGRAVLHTLLRANAAPAGLEQEYQAISDCQQRLRQWVEKVHNKQHLGYTGEAITDVVNLGIGGSDLGPRMVCQALAPLAQGPRVHFVANIDPAELAATLAPLNAATTLFIICSKTLTTEETLHNAHAARRWLLQVADETAIAHHFLAVSTNLAAAREFGIPEQNILPLWDWVGGRYSLWSAVGWSIAFAVGYDNFERLLAGAQAMDEHFYSAPLSDNMPVLLSLLEIWYVNFMGSRNHAVIPYNHHIRRLPAFLQQLSMESNGKSVNRAGQTLGYATAPVMWGDEGSNGQHSYHQLLHQGTLLCPVDFILPLRSPEPEQDMHKRLIAHCISQGQALMVGRDRDASLKSLLDRGFEQSRAEALADHLVIDGNRPSSTISFTALTPETLGALIALYEHKTFCSGWIWQINSFDQWGVELGKALSAGVYGALGDGDTQALDASNSALVQAWRTSQR